VSADLARLVRVRASTGKAWPYAGAGAGATISIAANVAHSLIPAHPQLGAVIGAVWWPLALFLALEVLISARWPRCWYWTGVRVVTVSPVAAVAAVVSYHHLSGLLAYYGEDSFTVRCGPVAVDGLMCVCTAALYAMRDHVVPAAPVGATAGEPEVAIPQRLRLAFPLSHLTRGNRRHP
jgi:hypothetical protein